MADSDNTTGLPSVSRRSLLAGVAAAAPLAAIPVIPAAAAMTPADPVLDIASEWWSGETAGNAGVSDEEMDAICDLQVPVGHRLFHTVSASIFGLEAKLLILGQLKGKTASDDIDAEQYLSDKLLISVLRDVRHLAGKRRPWSTKSLRWAVIPAWTALCYFDAVFSIKRRK